MRKEFIIAIILFLITCFITVIAPALYNGPGGIDGIGSVLAYVLFIRLMQAVLFVGSVAMVIIGVAKKNNWSKGRTVITATIPVIILFGIIYIPYAAKKIKTEIYLKTHKVEDLFSAKITDVSWINSQKNDATYLVLEYELQNIKADYFEKFNYEMDEMFSPYMNEASNQPYFVSQNGKPLQEPYYEYIRYNKELYPNYLHTDIHCGSNEKITLPPGESKTFCTIFELEDDTTLIDVNFVFSNGYAHGAGVVYSEKITPP